MESVAILASKLSQQIQYLLSVINILATLVCLDEQMLLTTGNQVEKSNSIMLSAPVNQVKKAKCIILAILKKLI